MQEGVEAVEEFRKYKDLNNKKYNERMEEIYKLAQKIFGQSEYDRRKKNKKFFNIDD